MQEVQSGKVNWDWLSKALNLFGANAVTWIVMQLIVFVIAVIAAVPIFGAGIAAIWAGQNQRQNPYLVTDEAAATSAMALAGAGLLSVLLLLIVIPVVVFLTVGMFKAAIKQTRGEQISISDLFSGKKEFLPVLGYILLMFVVVGIPGALISMIIPFFNFIAMAIVGGFLYFAIPQIVDGKAGIIDAIKNSIEITKKDPLMYILLAFVGLVIAGAGAIVFGIGVLVTYPIGLFLLQAVAYHDVFGAQAEGMPSPPPPPDHWMNNK